MALILVTVLVMFSHLTKGQYTNVSIEVDTQVVAIVDEFLVGVTIDSGNLPSGLEHLNLSSEKVRLLASGIAPCYLRIGGTGGDGMTFDPTGHDVEAGGTTFTGKTWDNINKFAADVGWRFIFGLNALKRKDGHWDPTNAIQLLNYTVERKYQMAGWELGNEPDIFPNKYNTTVSGQQLGRDFLALKSLLAQYPEFDSTLIIGPDVTGVSGRKSQFFSDFLSGGGGNAVDRITFHHYYENALTAKLADFTNPKMMDNLASEIETAQNLSRPTNPTTPIWLGESSSCYHGGAPGLSNTYVAGFLWLDKIALSAQLGIKGIMRQAFYGGDYSLINTSTYDPLPDYWLTYLHKQLAGSPILSAKTSTSGVRVYAHCVHKYNPFGYVRGTVVLSILLTGDEAISLSVPQFKGQPVHVFWLEPVGNITSQTVGLNGVPLELTENTFPELHPLVLQADNLHLPGKTFGFLAFPMADVAACQT